MDIKRIFVHAFVRRVAYALAAVVVGWLVSSAARAQSLGQIMYPDEGQAYAGCMAEAASVFPVPTGNANIERVLCNTNGGCRKSGTTFNAWYMNREKSSGATGGCAQDWMGRLHQHSYSGTNTCAARQPYVGPPPMSTVTAYPRQGAISCINGCAAVMFNNGDGTWTGQYGGGVSCTAQTLEQNCASMAGHHWNKWNQTCEPNEPQCDENQAKDPLSGACKDACPEGMLLNQDGQCSPSKPECPAGQIKSPEGACLPGEGQCAAGEARRENGTCGKDSDGDGQADEDDDNPDNDPDKTSFSGGDNCNAPPMCSGDAIMCGMARIQWRIDCNTRKTKNVSGGSCAAMPVCVGDNCDAVEYSQLLMQWRSACALEKLSVPGGGGGETGIKDHMTALKQAEVNALRGLPTSDGHEGVDPNSMFHTFDNSGFNPNLFGGGASQCPTGWTMGGMTFDVPPMFWTIATFIGWLFVAAAYVWLALELGR